jgi:hypothetical protein
MERVSVVKRPYMDKATRIAELGTSWLAETGGDEV